MHYRQVFLTDRAILHYRGIFAKRLCGCGIRTTATWKNSRFSQKPNHFAKRLYKFFNQVFSWGCESRYVGVTNRHLAIRVQEHLQEDTGSAVYEHLMMHDIRPNFHLHLDPVFLSGWSVRRSACCTSLKPPIASILNAIWTSRLTPLFIYFNLFWRKNTYSI